LSVLIFPPDRKNSCTLRDFIYRRVFSQIFQLLLALKVSATRPSSDVYLAGGRFILKASPAEFDARNLGSDVTLRFLTGRGPAEVNVGYRAIPTFAKPPDQLMEFC
jgi:hypothetical protein